MKASTFRNLLLLVLIVFAASCKKESAANDSDSYVKFKLNGKWVTYKALGELGPDLSDPSKTDFVVNGNSDDNKGNFSFSVQVDGPNLKVGTYNSDQYPQSYVTVDYMITIDASTIKDYAIDDVPGQAPSKYTINLTSISPTQLKGNFTGNYLYDSFNSDDPDGGVVKITEGEFQVKRID